MKLTLGYWDIRGNSATIRLMCAYAGQPLEEKVYTQAGKDEWFQEKPTLGLDFPNLPYLIVCDDDGGEIMRITQSHAILHYVATKLGLMGESDEMTAKAEMLVQQTLDFKMAMSALCYEKGEIKYTDETRAAFLEKTVPPFLASVEAFASSSSTADGPWLAGSVKPTFADFYLWHELEKLSLFSAGVLDAYPTLAAFVTRFEALETISAYMASDKHIHWPIYGAVAKWGGGGACPRNFPAAAAAAAAAAP